MLIEFSDDDMAALHETNAASRPDAGDIGHHLVGPRACGIDQCAGRGLALATGFGVFERQPPESAVAACGDATGAYPDISPSHRRIARIEHDKPVVLHPAIGIFEADRRNVAQRLARRMGPQPRVFVPGRSLRPPR